MVRIVRMTIYVPDDLKARMDEAGDAANWSAIAQRAFREAVAAENLRRNPTDMTALIERLRESKKRYEGRSYDHGKECGREWATLEAEYDELKRVAGFVRERYINPIVTVLQSLIDPNQEKDQGDWDLFWGERTNSKEQPEDAFALGFIEGASDVFNEIVDKL